MPGFFFSQANAYIMINAFDEGKCIHHEVAINTCVVINVMSVCHSYGFLWLSGVALPSLAHFRE